MTDASVDDRRALLLSALRAIDDLQARLDEREAAEREPIAIVGMGCRFPGGASTPEAFWDLLREGRDVVTDYPSTRRELLVSSGVDPGAFEAAARWFGGFLDEIDGFDPQFFGISPREAATMDPQQRLALEVAWEALERAGIAPDSLHGSSAGVFLGITSSDYGQLGRMATPETLDVYSATGGALNAAAGRIAYTLGLQGPCMAIDTACSSSLVAVHQACRSLRSGESDLALAGGVNVLMLPEAFVCFERWGMMAADGRCKTFDAAADGFVRGEGCGMVVLKRLRDAMAAGDPVLAVINGSAVNQDGRSSGLTVPNGLAQQAVIRSALADARIDPADVQYFEAHGTGTTLGDPIEVEALGEVLGRGRGRDTPPLLLGSVKTNLGHLESAAGIAGIIKVVLAMQHGQIPASLHFQRPSERIPWPDFPTAVPTELTSWPGSDGVRIAGVSGFGFSGTNAHLVLQSPPASTRVEPDSRPGRVVLLGARSESALRTAARELACWLDANPHADVADIATTLLRGRARANHRAGLVAGDTTELVRRLEALADGADGELVVSGPPRRRTAAFLFTGQGSQYAGMARELYGTEPRARDVIDRCCAIVDPLIGASLLDVMFDELGGDEAGLIDHTRYTQPALFVLEYALAELWRSWGVLPGAVLGHSVGELVAATVAGVLTLEDALRLVVARGSLMQALPEGGAMVALLCPAADIEALVAERGDVSIAAINGPAHTVVSGASESVAAITDAMTTRGVSVQRLTVSHAFHSPLMVPMLDEFRRVAATVSFHPPSIPLVSNVTGAFAGPEVATAEYWVRHVVAPVRFADGLAAMRNAGHDLFVEIGPHPVLTAMGRSGGGLDGAVAVASLRRNRADTTQLLEAVARLAVDGIDIDWHEVRAVGRRIALPCTPFERRRCWLDPVPVRSVPRGGHPLLGVSVPAPVFGATIHHAEIGVTAPAWLDHHRLVGTPVFPGTGFLEAVLAVAAGAECVDMLSIDAPLVLPDEGTVALQTVVTTTDGGRDVQVVSVADHAVEHTVHARGRLSPFAGSLDRSPEPIEPETVAAAFAEEVDVAAYYGHLESVGLDYGPTFRGLERLVRRERAALGLARLPAECDGAAYRLHPALLDACFHVLGAAIASPDDESADSMYVPVAMRGVRLMRPGAPAAWCAATLIDRGPEEPHLYEASLALYDPDGEPIATVDSLEVRRTERAAWARLGARAGRNQLHRLVWRGRSPSDDEIDDRGWVIVGDRRGTGVALDDALRRAGSVCNLLDPACFDHLSGRSLTDELVRLAGGGRPLSIVDLRGLDIDDLPVDVAQPASPATRSLTEAERMLGGALDLVRAASVLAPGSARLFLVTRGGQSVHGEPPSPAAATCWGFARVVRTEVPHLECTCLDLDPALEPSTAALAEALVLAGDEEAIALRGRDQLVARLVPAELDVPLGPSRLALASRGSFDALGRSPLVRRPPAEGEVEVEVRATGLNFRDVMNVLGMLPGEAGQPGLECAGVVTAVGPLVEAVAVGDRVLGIAPSAFDSYVTTRADLVVRTPTGLTHAQAATIPIAFATAAHGLTNLARLRPGERVLVHAGAGGVGMAAVQLAQRIGAEVYATVGSDAKRAVLERLGVRHIYSSRTVEFATQIMSDTDGAGVDVVLNSLADEYIDRSFEVLAPNGRFLELGKRGIWSHERVAAERPDVGYHPYDLADLVGAPGVLHSLLQDATDAIATGVAEPLPLRAFRAEHTDEAFRYMAQARHIGKVVVTHPSLAPHVRSDGAYLVTGGLGGVGSHVAGWLAANGAGRIVLCGRSAPSAEDSTWLTELRAAGSDVVAVPVDVTDAAAVGAALEIATRDGVALRGVFHAAGTVDDGVLAHQSTERFARVLAPKLVGSEVLDAATRGHDLDHFVLFSSASALLGAPGQSAYAAANRALDAIAARRRAIGLPALSIDWGEWEGVGMAARIDEHVRARVASLGVRAMPPAEAVVLLDRLLDESRPCLLAVDVEWPTVLASMPSAPTLFAELARPRRDGVGLAASSAPATGDLIAELLAAPIDERGALVRAVVLAEVVAVLGLASAEVDQRVGLSDLGMDSLMAIELANRLSARFGRRIAATAPFEHPTIGELTDHATELLALDVAFASMSAGVEAPSTPSHVPDVDVDDIDIGDALLRELDDAGY